MGRDGRGRAAEEGAGAGRACPKCGAAMAPEAVLCVDCGYHLGHGRAIRSHESRPAESPDPDRKWLYAAGGLAALGVVLVGLLIWWTSGPPSIVGKWTGRAVLKIGDQVGYSDPVSLTFRKDGTASCSDGTAGDYSIQGDTLRVRLEKPTAPASRSASSRSSRSTPRR